MVENKENLSPDKFPFWARLRIEKKRPTLVIDEDFAYDKQRNKMVDGYVHREVTHSNNKNTEKISPNPDKKDSCDMYLKRPRKTPKYLFTKLDLDFDMPEDLKKRYEGNNKKKDDNSSNEDK